MAFEQLRGRWESMAPREKRLVLALAVTFVVCVLGFVWIQVASSLSRMEAQNATAREALRLIAEHQDDILEKRNSPDDPERQIPDTAQPLSTYLEGLAAQAGNMSIPDSNPRPAVVKGKYRELSIDISLHGVSLDQLTKFLRLVETSAPGVVTQRIKVHPFISAHDKLDVELTIAAYEKNKTMEKPKSGGGADAGKSGT
jgi:Tfp pilus assembly protein PilO